MKLIEKRIEALGRAVNWVAAAAVIAMMLLTTLDVLLRALRSPIPGTYECVGLLSALAVSFSLACTSIEKGHIAVEVLVQRLSARTQALVQALNAAIAGVLFAVVTWQLVCYGIQVHQTGEVSLTISLPIYPFVFGAALGFALLCPVLAVECARALRRHVQTGQP